MSASLYCGTVPRNPSSYINWTPLARRCDSVQPQPLYSPTNLGLHYITFRSYNHISGRTITSPQRFADSPRNRLPMPRRSTMHCSAAMIRTRTCQSRTVPHAETAGLTWLVLITHAPSSEQDLCKHPSDVCIILQTQRMSFDLL